jgi:hypothetical protein
MYRKNQRHLQPYLISNVNDLPDKQRKLLDASWSGVFFREFYSRLDEQPFSVLYADLPSRPNAPINELVSLEFLKAGRGWTDEEMYEHYLFDLQTRHALGLDQLGEAHFELRTIYNFRQRLSHYMQEQGINLLDQAFEQVTDAQLAAFQLKTGQQRMDSMMLSSNIRQMGRVQLLVEVLQRVQRMLNEADQLRYAETFAPYLHGHAGQYIYRLKNEEIPSHLQQIGSVMQGLMAELQPDYGKEPVYALLVRVFGEHFKLEGEAVQSKAASELSAQSLQSPDDQEATYREKRGVGYQGYSANVTETCDPDNPFQLLTKVQTAPNCTDDSQFLAEAVPNLVERTAVDTIYTDGGHGGPQADQELHKHGVTQIQTAIRGRQPNSEKLHLADFEIKLSAETRKPTQITCPSGQTVSVQTTHQQKSYVASFDLEKCRACPFFHNPDELPQEAAEGQLRCPAQIGKRDTGNRVRFTQAEAYAAQRRRICEQEQKLPGNRRAAVEATVRSVKLPFPAAKLPVRGQFRVTCMVVGSAAVTNVRRIQRYLTAKNRPETSKKSAALAAKGQKQAAAAPGAAFFAPVLAAWRRFWGHFRPQMSLFAW